MRHLGKNSNFVGPQGFPSGVFVEAVLVDAERCFFSETSCVAYVLPIFVDF